MITQPAAGGALWLRAASASPTSPLLRAGWLPRARSSCSGSWGSSQLSGSTHPGPGCCCCCYRTGQPWPTPRSHTVPLRPRGGRGGWLHEWTRFGQTHKQINSTFADFLILINELFPYPAITKCNIFFINFLASGAGLSLYPPIFYIITLSRQQIIEVNAVKDSNWIYFTDPLQPERP